MSALTDATNTIIPEKDVAEKTIVADKTEESTTVVENSAPEVDSTTTVEDKLSNEADSEKEAAEKTNVAGTTEESATVAENSAPKDEVADEAVAEKKAGVAIEAEAEKKADVAMEAEAEKTADVTEEPTKVESTTVANEADAPVESTVEAAEEAPMEEVSEELSREEKIKKSEEHIIAGRRFMKTNAFDQATESFSQAAALVAEIHGEGAEETFEANFLYGKALLELGKVEDEVLTNALTDIPKGDDGVQDDVVENPDDVPEEERDEIKQKVEEALAIKVTSETIDEETTDDKEEKVAESAEETKEEQADSEKEESAEITEAEDVEMEAAEEQDAEDPEAEQADDGSEADVDEPIKLAWEILETCRCICEKKLKTLESEENADAEAVKTWKLNHADVLTSLGEHGMIDSKYEQAQKDLTEAVVIQTALLSETSRILANTTHLLAKAFSLDSGFELAATHFSNAKNILIAKVEELKKMLDTAAENEKSEIEAEIKELEEIVPELDVFVNDARASAEQTAQIKETVKNELAAAAENIAKMSGEETKDITDMVRRPTKRPASEEPVEEVKKRKSEEAVTTVPDETAMETTEESESASTPVAPATSE